MIQFSGYPLNSFQYYYSYLSLLHVRSLQITSTFHLEIHIGIIIGTMAVYLVLN